MEAPWKVLPDVNIREEAEPGTSEPPVTLVNNFLRLTA